MDFTPPGRILHRFLFILPRKMPVLPGGHSEQEQHYLDTVSNKELSVSRVTAWRVLRLLREETAFQLEDSVRG